MNFIGIDLHTNKFTCCFRTEQSKVDNPKDRVITTFDLTGEGLATFYQTLTEDTYVLVEATITTFSFVRLFRDRVKVFSLRPKSTAIWLTGFSRFKTRATASVLNSIVWTRCFAPFFPFCSSPFFVFLALLSVYQKG